MCPTNPQLVNLGLADGERWKRLVSFTHMDRELPGWSAAGWRHDPFYREGTQMKKNLLFITWDVQGVPLPALHKTLLRPPVRPFVQVTACLGIGQPVWVGHKRRSFWCFHISHIQIKLADLHNQLTGCAWVKASCGDQIHLGISQLKKL